MNNFPDFGGPVLNQRQARIFSTRLYHVVTNTDLTEGRGGLITLAWTTSADLAQILGKGKDVQGTDCPVKGIHLQLAQDGEGQLYRLEPLTLTRENPEDIRRRALAKLSAEEKAALGL